MSKVIKFLANLILHTISGVVLIAFLLILAVAMALSLPRVQTLVADEAATWLSEKCGVKVEVGAISLEYLSRLTAEELYVEDLQGDTLLWVSKFSGAISREALFKGRVEPRRVHITDGKFYLVEHREGGSNVDHLVEHIASFFPADTTPTTADFAIRNITADNFRFKFYDERLAGRTPESAIDYSDMDVRLRGVHFGEILIASNGEVRFTDIDNINALDRSGAALYDSSMGSLTVGHALLDFRNVDFRSGESQLRLPHLILAAAEWEDYADFCDLVKMNISMRGCTLKPEDGGKWVAELGYYDFLGENINGIFEGTVNDFATDLSGILYDSRVTLISHVKNIIAPQRLRADVDVELTTTSERVRSIYQSIVHSPMPENAMQWIAKTDSLHLDATAQIAPGEITTNSFLNTDLGGVDVVGTLNYGTEGEVNFDGEIATESVNLGELISQENIGNADVVLKGNVRVSEQVLEGDVNARIESLLWGNYDFRNVELHAIMADSLLKATLNSTDPSVLLNAEGEGNFAGSEPEYNLIMNIEMLDFGAIGIAPEGKTSWLAANMEASLRGLSFDDMVGRAMINDLTYASAADTLSTELVNLSLAGGLKDKSFSLYSPIVDVEYRSTAPYKRVLKYLTSTLPSQLPLAKSLEEPTEGADGTIAESYGTRLYAADDYTAATVNIKEGERLAAVLYPNARLAPDSSVSVEFSPAAQEFRLTLESDYVAVEDVVISDLRVDADGVGYDVGINAECEELLAKGLYVPEVSINAAAHEGGEVDLTLFFSNIDTDLSGRLEVGGTLLRDSLGGVCASAAIADSYIISPSKHWNITAQKIDYSTGKLNIDGFGAENGTGGGLYINGEVSASTDNPLKLQLRDVAIEEWLSLLTTLKDVEGVTNGEVEIYAATTEPFGKGSLALSKLQAGGVQIDPMELVVEIPKRSSTAKFALTNTVIGSTLARGEYDYQQRGYRADLVMKETDLSMLNPLFTGVASNIKGMSTIDLQISGSNKSIDIDGTVEIDNFSSLIDLTGANYSAERVDIRFENNKGIISPVRIEDGNGGWAEVEGHVDLKELSNVAYGFSLVPHNLIALDLPAGNNNPFYGKVYASGGLKVGSEGGTTDISGAITTGAGSIFNLPLTGNNDFAGADFVTFVDRSEEQEEVGVDIIARSRSEKPRKVDIEGGVMLDVMLNVGTNTLLRLIVDPATDNVIEARGVADLGITYDQRKDEFNIRGDYEIAEGVYNFNFQNLITKQFIINPDSYIRWNGNPLDANIDVGATYKLKTSLAPLLGAERTTSRASTPVECIVNLTGSLSKVDVSFDINVPNANTEYQSILSSYFSSQEMMATQFVYLLALGNFYSDTAPQQTNTPGAAGSAIGIDFLASQVSRLVSNDAYKFNLKYKAIDDTSSSYSLDFETEIIDDRLVLELEANVDTGDYYKIGDNSTGNQLSGGGALTLLLDDSGNFYLKGFSRTIDRFDENQGLQENGLGLYYKRSFNHFSDLWRKKKRDKAEKESGKRYNFVDSFMEALKNASMEPLNPLDTETEKLDEPQSEQEKDANKKIEINKETE